MFALASNFKDGCFENRMIVLRFTKFDDKGGSSPFNNHCIAYCVQCEPHCRCTIVRELLSVRKSRNLVYNVGRDSFTLIFSGIDFAS